MRILITGGFGLIGGRLGQHLHRAGHQVILGSRNARSSPDWLPQAEMVQTDWNDERALEQICCGVDVVIQAAGMNAQDCAANPVAALEFNGLATARLLGAASRVGVKRFIYLSTAHVYASPLVGTITEDTCPRNLHPYAASHLAGENAVLNVGQRGQIEAIVLRLSNAFGVPVHKDVNCWMLLVNDLCRQAVQSGKMVLHSSGLQQRDFIALTDVTRAVMHCLDIPKSECGDGLFNLGGARAMRVIDLANHIAQCCGEMLGYVPPILRPQASAGEKNPPLTYQIGKLLATGFNLRGNLDEEINDTLRLCMTAFGRKIK